MKINQIPFVKEIGGIKELWNWSIIQLEILEMLFDYLQEFLRQNNGKSFGESLEVDIGSMR
jgi:hypothetical protein